MSQSQCLASTDLFILLAFVKQFTIKIHHFVTRRFLKHEFTVERFSDSCLHKIATPNTGKEEEMELSQSQHKVNRLMHYNFFENKKCSAIFKSIQNHQNEKHAHFPTISMRHHPVLQTFLKNCNLSQNCLRISPFLKDKIHFWYAKRNFTLF